MRTTGRHHYVFLAACGCLVGLTEATGGRIGDEATAWRSMYGSPREQAAARARGVTVVHVDHATYVETYFESMFIRCAHTNPEVA